MPDLFTKEAVPSYKRKDSHSIDPREIRLDPDLNGRIDPPTQEDIDQRIADFLNPRVGQLQPILIAKDEDGYPIIVDGHIRWMAAIEITKQKLGPFDGVFKLKCEYFVGTPMDRFIATVKANHRKDPTASDDGYNISRLIHNFGMSEEDVATKVYGRKTLDGKPDVKWVRERLAFAELVPEAREALTNGKLKLNQVQLLAALTKSAQKAKLKAAGDGTIKTSMLRDAPVSTNGNGHAPRPKFSDVRNFWKPYAEQETETPLVKFSKAQTAWLNGESTADELWEVIKSLLGAK